MYYYILDPQNISLEKFERRRAEQIGLHVQLDFFRTVFEVDEAGAAVAAHRFDPADQDDRRFFVHRFIEARQ